MIENIFPIWSSPSHKVTLSEILKSIEGENLQWRVLFFCGVGEHPIGFSSESIVDFERYLLNTPEGYSISWLELISFAAGLGDLHDIDLIGERVSASGSAFIYEIEGFDDTQWTVRSAL